MIQYAFNYFGASDLKQDTLVKKCISRRIISDNRPMKQIESILLFQNMFPFLNWLRSNLKMILLTILEYCLLTVARVRMKLNLQWLHKVG